MAFANGTTRRTTPVQGRNGDFYGKIFIKENRHNIGVFGVACRVFFHAAGSYAHHTGSDRYGIFANCAGYACRTAGRAVGGRDMHHCVWHIQLYQFVHKT